MDETQILAYVAALEAALGDNNRFQQVVERIERDGQIKQRDLAAIVSSFYGKIPANTPRTTLLRRIWTRQQSLMDYKAKSRAQAGKSAA